MKKLLLFVSLFLVSAGAFAQIELKEKVQTTTEFDANVYKFKDVKRLKTPPVGDQFRTGTCWCFTGIGLFETDLMEQTGKEYKFSEMWVVRNAYMMKAERYIRMHGENTFGQGAVASSVIEAVKKYGLMPENVYTGLINGQTRHDHVELSQTLKTYLDAIIKNPNGKITPSWRDGFTAILDAYLGKAPEKFMYEGREYTPMSFLEMTGLKMDEYVTITSFTHHPYYEEFVLEVPDNWGWTKSYNVPMNELLDALDTALENGYSVSWDADVSEKGFQHSNGVAVMPMVMENGKVKKNGKIPQEIDVTPQERQLMFDTYETTDDHFMLIVGTAQDQNGNKFYIVKNSWNTDSRFEGYLYASLPYMKGKTLGILVNKNGLPDYLKTKLGL